MLIPFYIHPPPPPTPTPNCYQREVKFRLPALHGFPVRENLIFLNLHKETQAPSEEFKRSNHADVATLLEITSIAPSENIVKKEGGGYKIE